MLGTQEIYRDEKGCLRFKENHIVSMLVDNFEYKGLEGLNAVAMWSNLNDIPDEEYSQLMQLIGYSIDGWGMLSTTSDSDWEDVVEKLNEVE